MNRRESKRVIFFSSSDVSDELPGALEARSKESRPISNDDIYYI